MPAVASDVNVETDGPAPCPALALPLYQAVHELESEICWVLVRHASARDSMRARRARKMLGTVTGLSRFYPPAHPVHEAGSKLAAVCLPLLADPANATRRRLPEFCFRLMQELKEDPRRSLQRAVLDRLHQFDGQMTAGVAGNVEPAALLWLIRLLHPFLARDCSAVVFAPAFLNDSLQNAKTCRADPLPALLRVHYQLRLASLTAQNGGGLVPATLLQPWLQLQLDAIAGLCGASTWTLAFYCESGLAALLHDSRILAMWCDRDDCGVTLQHLAAQLLDLHLAGRTPGSEVLQPLLCQMFALMMGDPAKRESHGIDQPAGQGGAGDISPEGSPDPELAVLLAAELRLYRNTLLAWLYNADTKNFQSLDALDRVLYKLQWVYAAAGNDAMKLLAGLAYQLCAQYWFIGRALPPHLLRVLQQLSTLIVPDRPQGCPSGRGRLLQRQLLQAWPGTCSTAGLHVALAPDVLDSGTVIQEACPAVAEVSQLAPVPAMVPLHAVPALLSSSFATLVQLPADIPASGLTSARRRIVVAELALLEKGAAALKIWPLEHLCIQMLAIYAVLERQHSLYPAALLGAAHSQLIAMLDQAAAWQQTVENPALLIDLQKWLDRQAAQPASLQASGISDHAGIFALHDRLQAYVQTLAHAIEKPVRLQFGKCPADLPAVAMTAVETSLKPVLKFILLDNSAMGPGRRALHKPLMSNICVDIRQTAQELRVHIFEDGPGAPLAAVQLQLLQRRLPADASLLSSTAQAGRGRSFHYRLPLCARPDTQTPPPSR